MRHAFGDLRRQWGVENVTASLLMSGHCREGADAVAELLWRNAGLPQPMLVPADWKTLGKSAGPRRNQHMVDITRSFQDTGIPVVCVAFLGSCHKTACPRRREQQLSAYVPGHFSHGTVDCRAQR